MSKPARVSFQSPLTHHHLKEILPKGPVDADLGGRKVRQVVGILNHLASVQVKKF